MGSLAVDVPRVTCCPQSSSPSWPPPSSRQVRQCRWSGPSRGSLSMRVSSQGRRSFQWEDGHNVERVSQEGYDTCSGFKSSEPVAGPFDFKTSTPGTYYFVCGV